ncbi:DUF3015 family protein [Spirobacillus cienkowskii]|uniref:DUF3015 family protein n=1 Tax=Spirobacillus cienkowskii TaxID=495820 RepID=UPI0030D5541D
MKLKKLLIFSALSVFVLSNKAFSQNPFAKKGNYKSTEAYGMSGCGVASIFIKEKDMLPQIGASVVNNIFGPTQTFAMSSGTSNCVAPRSDMALKQEQEVFMAANFSSLNKEAAQGNGEHISALAEVFGCPQEQFLKLSQENYNKLFDSSEPTVVLENYKKELKEHNTLSGSCERLI